jgi:hypothetical protein
MFKSTQTKILGTATLLAVFTGALFYLLKGEGRKSGSFLLFAGLPLLINLYTVHCVVYGKCTTYSWLLTVILTLYAAGIFILYTRLFLKGEEVRRVVNQKTTEAKTLQKVVEETIGMN